MNILEKIRQIEEEIRKTPYHKATEHHIGRLRARLTKLREELLTVKKGKKGARGGFAIKKQGDATIVLLGFPSVGKSTLLNKLTNAQSKIASYAFTTVKVIPGMMEYKGALIQILDLPGIIEQAAKGKGHGRQILSLVKNANLLLLISEVGKEFQFKLIKQELKLTGILLNQRDYEQRIYTNLPAIFLVNKIDLKVEPRIPKNNIFYISAKENIGLENLKEEIWKKLNLKRIYFRKSLDSFPDFNSPLIVKKDFKISQIAAKISTDLVKKVKNAKIWQGNAKHPGQEVGLNFKPSDETVVYFKS